MLERVSRAFVVYGLIYLVVALVVDLPARFEALARLQPLRSLHFLYIVMFVVMGGFLAEYVLKDRVWRWLLLFAPLSLGNVHGAASTFSSKRSRGMAGRRTQESVGAGICLDPAEHARGCATSPSTRNIWISLAKMRSDFVVLRSAAAWPTESRTTEWSACFLPLAEEWWAQVQAQTPWKNFRAEDFSRLKSRYGVSWVVVQQPGVAGLDCPYQNSAVRVCRIR